MSSFVHLHVHSQYSILTATSQIQDLVERAKEQKMSALALTDSSNLYGAVEFYKECLARGIQPILGLDAYLAPKSRHIKKKEYGVSPYTRLTLLCKNETGYKNLCKLSSKAFLEGFYFNPRIDEELLVEHKEGLICLSGGVFGKLATVFEQKGYDEAKNVALFYRQVFKEDFYLEVQRHVMTEEALKKEGFYEESHRLQQYRDHIKRQEEVNKAFVALSKELSMPLVATNDVYYLNRLDFSAHEILLNIQSGETSEIWEKDSMGNLKSKVLNPKRRTFPTHEYNFKTEEEMKELFSDLPEAIGNSLAIAKKCSLSFDFEKKNYPAFIPEQLEGRSYTEEERKQAVNHYLTELCTQGIKKRYTEEKLALVAKAHPGKPPLQVVKERLQLELDVIIPKEMSDYLLIVWDFIHWAKTHGIPVGPGRGSGAGSIVLYLIGVTDIEPLCLHLFFERFINPERVSYPDIDVDICMERRHEVIQYTLSKYGKDNVAQIITFGTMKAKMSVKDVGRVLNVPLTKVNQIAKLIPEDLSITLDKALEVDPDLKKMYEADEETRRVLDIGRKLEGSIRNTGIHAAGIIISQKPLTDLIPICLAKESDIPATQYSMKPVEQVGMLKIDFLGLKTLTAIHIAVSDLAANGKAEIDWVNLPLNDKNTYDLLNKGRTLGVFQLESAGMQDLARQLHLDRFEEIIAVGALYRPGPMDMIPSFINRKHGREKIEYDHPLMEEILAETYGIMVYQEQVMQIASKLAGYSLGEGDVLRRAMGKKDRKQMEQQREKFREGAASNGILSEVSMRIFDKIEKFASYGFNKSHAAAYGYISYVTAYLKANFPSEWMAALMSCDRGDISKVSKFIREAAKMGISILSPDVNESSVHFRATSEGIRFSMSAIKGVGEQVVTSIIEERTQGGPFLSLYDFIRRMDPKKAGKKVIESLVDAGCFDFTGWTRDELVLSIDPMFEAAIKKRSDEKKGVLTFFSLMGEDEEERFSKRPEVLKPRNLEAIYLREKELLGFFLTGHPMDRFKEILERLSCVPLSKIIEQNEASVFRSGVIVESLEVRYSSKTKKKFAILRVSDGLSSLELPIWPDLFEEKSALLSENSLLYCVLQTEIVEGALRLSCRWLDDLRLASEQMIKECDLAFDKAKEMAKRRPYQKVEKKREQKVEKKYESLLLLSLCIDSVKLSEIVLIKRLFEENRGDTKATLRFYSDKKPVADVEIEPRWGVTLSPTLKESLQKINAILQVETQAQ